jgi:flagellar hook assembly protein FlgD
VETEATASVDPGTSASGLTLSRRGPSPARGPVALSFTLPHAAAVQLAIYDLSGRHVRELSSGVRTAGEHVISWDLHDEAGRAVGAGLYFAQLRTEGHQLTQKIPTLR